MSKKIFKNSILVLVMAVLCMAVAMTASAVTDTGKCGTNLTWSFDTETGVLDITGSGAMSNYTSSTNVPWNSYVSQITTVNLPKGLTSIGGYAFFYCTKLSSVEIPESVKSIGESAFEYCSALESVILPDGVKIEPYAFMYSGIKSVVISDGCSIGVSAFKECSKLTDIALPGSITTIDLYDFDNGGKSKNFYYAGTKEEWNTVKIYTSNYLAYVKMHYCEVVTTEATCTENGTVEYVCTDCTGSMVVKVLPTSEHTYKEVVTAPTCTAQGFTTYTCECGDSYVADYVDKITHEYQNAKCIHCGKWKETAVYGECGDDLNWVLDTEIGVLYIGGSGAMYDYPDSTKVPWLFYRAKIKEVVIGDGVATIGKYAFYYCENLTSVTISDSVTSIGDWAFCECARLASVTIGGSVTSIGEDAFGNCEALTTFIVDENNAYYSSDEYGVLFNKDKTTLIQYPTGNTRTLYTIPNSVTSIGEDAFYYCESLTSVRIPDSVISIGAFAFAGCYSLIDVYYGSTEEQWNDISIGIYNDSLTNAIIHFAKCAHEYQNAKCIHCGQWKETAVYGDCGDDLGWVIDTETGVLYIGGSGAMYDYAFGDSPFWRYSVTSVVIGDGVTTIGDCAFANLREVTEISIPKNIISIGEDAFGNWEALTTFIVDENNAYYSSDEYGVLFNKDKTKLIDYPKGNKRTEYSIPDSVVSIEKAAFINCDNIETVIFGKNVTTIPEDAFNHCGSLKDVVLSDSVTSIGMYAFYNCYFTSITIPASVKNIDKGAFVFCYSLKDVYYGGTEEQWAEININSTNNEKLTNATIHYNSCLVNSDKKHSYTSEITTPATHLTEGVETFTCSACGYTYTEAVAKLEGHSYTSEITTEPTHLKEGVETFTCECGDTYTKPVAKLEKHTYKSVVTDPTCTEQGYTTYTCECGDSYVADYVDENGHNYTSEITTQPTHLTEGVETFTCSACGDTYTEVVEKTAQHTYKSVVTDPTCTEKGFTTYTCECGEVYVADYVDENGHTYTSEITTQPTHLKEGTEKFTCSACSDSYTKPVAKLEGHTYKAVVTEPTCTDRGFTTYTCECGYSYNGNYVGSKGHSYSSVVTKQPTHLKEGVETFTCSVCGDSYKEDIAKLPDHTYTVKGVTAPTCTAQGYTTFVCACGDTYKSDYVPAAGHSDNNSDGICDSCGRNLNTNPASCSHLCHKNGFMGFIWKIVRFFYKLLGSNKVCTCGVAHY